MRYAVLDFETRAIAPRPDYPPVPVSFALRLPGREPRFYSWGHPSGNNCTYDEARATLATLLDRKLPIVFHNAKFDLAVMDERMGLQVPGWDLIHDTMILAHLSNPYEPTFALKPMAEKHLSLPPAERDAVRDWLIEHGVCRPNDKQWGAHIAEAPGDLVGAYAIGDVDRTALLFDKLHEDVTKRGMTAAYDRERALIPLLHANEKHGLRVALGSLEADYLVYSDAMARAEDWLRGRLGVPDLNLDANQQMAAALERAGIVTDFAMTATGKPSVSKATLTKDKFSDERVYQVLGYRNRLQTCLGTFMGPWLETARKNGRIYTSWRQLGAVTGRQSSTPNFQNLIKSWRGFDMPEGFPVLPLLRRYILPDEGDVLIGADYSGQEVRVAAHYEAGSLREAYVENPKLDPHQFVVETIERLTGTRYDRHTCKTALFSWFYGAGVRTMADRLDCSEDSARMIRNALFMALPGIRDMDAELKQLARCNEPFTTLGGREYYCEPPKMIDGRIVSWEYKLLNYLIQGSSADMTKAAMLRYDSCRQHGRLLLTVHDELVLSVPAEHADTEARILTDAMENAMPMSIPLIAETKMGHNFAEMK